MRYRALRSLSILALVLLTQSCADMPFAPNIEPPFWEAHGRSIRLEAHAAGPPGFDGYGDPQTFGTFRVDTEAEAALRCAAARTIDVSPSIRKLAELVRTRGLALDPEIVQSRPFSRASYTNALREFSHWSGRHPLRVYSAPGVHRTGMN